MSHRKSSSEVEDNRETWSKNITHFEKSTIVRGRVELVVRPLYERNRIPLKKHIYGRFQYLASNIKDTKERLKNILTEVKRLWTEVLNFPIITDQAVIAKLEKVVDLYRECSRRSNFEKLDEVFDVTKLDGTWLNAEDKKLHKRQIESKGRVGYSDKSFANISTIHPSKRAKLDIPTTSKKFSDSSTHDDEEMDWETQLETEDSKDTTYVPSDISLFKKQRHSTEIAADLVTTTHISTYQSSKVLKKLNEGGYNVPTPSQSGIHKRFYKDAMMVSIFLVMICLLIISIPRINIYWQHIIASFAIFRLKTK